MPEPRRRRGQRLSGYWTTIRVLPSGSRSQNMGGVLVRGGLAFVIDLDARTALLDLSLILLLLWGRGGEHCHSRMPTALTTS